MQACAAELRELTQLERVLGAGIAVGEIAAEVELERLGQPGGLRDGLGILGESRRHRCRRGQDVGEVPAPVGLRGVERRMQAERDERILQWAACPRVRVHVAGGHAAQLQPPCQPGQAPVARAVTRQIGALKLDAKELRPESLAQTPQRRLVVDAA